MTGIQNLPKRWTVLMQKYGISARSVAKKASVNLPHFYNVLNQKSSPTLEYVAKIETVIENMVDERDSVVVPITYEFAASRNTNAGEQNETGGDTQQRTDGQLS